MKRQCLGLSTQGMPHRQTLAESRFDTTPPSTINGAIRLPGQHVPTSQYLSTEPAHIREQPLTNPYGRPSAAVSSTAGFVQTKAQQTECPQPPSEAREIGQFFVHSTEYPRGHRFFTPKPEEISFLPPLAIKRPDLAETRQLSLQRVPPCILFVQFPCKQRCRSLGICIHYQFVVPCGKCPDGLICPACMRNNTQQAISASRKCPLHHNPDQPNPINNRVEDFLATDPQKALCDEILARSLACRWEDTPRLTQPTNQCEGEDESSTDKDRFTRESTPRNLDDVQMMDSVMEQTEESQDGEIYTLAPPSSVLLADPDAQPSTSTDLDTFDLFGGPLGMQVSMPQRFGGRGA